MTPPSQTELERALTEIRRLSQCSKYYIEQFEFIEAAAKRSLELEVKLKEVEVENLGLREELADSITRNNQLSEDNQHLSGGLSVISQERDQLRADYKQALEALKEIDDDLKQNMSEYERLDSTNEALSTPSAQAIRKGDQ